LLKDEEKQGHKSGMILARSGLYPSGTIQYYTREEIEGTVELSGSTQKLHKEVTTMENTLNEAAASVYLCTKVLPDPKMFYGRRKLLERIFAIIAVHGSISLVGPSRIGKGSLLYCLRFQEFQQIYGAGYREKLSRCLFVFLDMRSFAKKNWEQFFLALNKEIVTHCRGIVKLDLTPPAESDGFSTLVKEIGDQGYFLVLALDSFEKLKDNKHLSTHLPLFLRSETDNVSYIIASTASLHEVFPHEPLTSPLWNIFREEKIGGLTPKEARQLVEGPANMVDLPFTSVEVDWILRQGGNHPLFLNQVSRAVLDLKLAAPGDVVNEEEAETLAYDRLAPVFGGYWNALDEQQQENWVRSLYKVEIPELYGSALFQHFVASQPKKMRIPDLDDIKEALKVLGEPPKLGESNLRHLKLVADQLSHQMHPSKSQVGIAVRTVLYDAWKLMAGHGQRTDDGLYWEEYNILYYCYFKHHLHNDQAAARLDITGRTFYRRKYLALNKLLVTLLEMETNTRP